MGPDYSSPMKTLSGVKGWKVGSPSLCSVVSSREPRPG